MSALGIRLQGRLEHYRNDGAFRLRGGVVERRTPTHDLTMTWPDGHADLRIVGDAPILPFGVDVDDVEVVITVELRWPGVMPVPCAEALPAKATES